MTDPQFDPNDPFPLSCALSRENAVLHAEAVDEWLGLRVQEIESALVRPTNSGPSIAPSIQELWIGLPARSLLTPYTEIRALLSQLNPEPGSTIVDLGAAYGRMGFVIGRHYPSVRFLGYEYVKERVHEGQRCLSRWNYPDVRLERADLSAPDFLPAAAEYYFLYDYGSRAAIEKTLEDLRVIARERRITVVGRGRASRDAIERRHPWLAQVVPPEHSSHYSIYRSAQ